GDFTPCRGQRQEGIASYENPRSFAPDRTGDLVRSPVSSGCTWGFIGCPTSPLRLRSVDRGVLFGAVGRGPGDWGYIVPSLPVRCTVMCVLVDGNLEHFALS